MSIPGTIYEAIGGEKPIRTLVNSLYKHIGKEAVLLEIFPEDLNESARKQYLFLTQLFGGPQLYLEDRGHPMLRRRHLPFEINQERKEAWLRSFEKALDETGVEDPLRTAIFQRISMTAEHMVNQPN